MWRVVTDLAILGFDEVSREMKVLAMHDGVTREQIQDNTGFPLKFNANVQTTPPPSKAELEVLRELDPQALYTA
jgi:glutaconate CoA-transferase subunit B